MLKRKLCELWDDLHRKKNYASCGPQVITNNDYRFVKR